MNEFKNNFFTSYRPFCLENNHLHEDTQAHALIFESLKNKITVLQLQALNSVEAQYNVKKGV